MAGEIAVAPPRRALLYREISGCTKNLSKALATAQGQFQKVVKNKSAQYGPFADLASMRDATVPALSANGLAVTQEYHLHEADLLLVTVLSHESGEWITSTVPIKQAASPQATMGYMTYMRRAAYAAILCLAAEDDDDGQTANSAAVAAQVEGEEALEKRALAVIQAATSREQLDTLLKKVQAQVASNRMTPDSLSRLQVEAVKVLARLTEGGK